MRKTIVLVLIALHFAKMKVVDLLPFARSIHDNAGADPGVSIDPAIVLLLNGQITVLSATVTLRETDKSTALTTLEGNQATDVILTLTDIASSVQKQANAIIPGNTGRATLAIQRIGFTVKKAASLAGRTFEVFKTAVGAASIRVKADKTFSLYHWRWSLDGTTWTRVADTRGASIVLFGLPHNKIVFFQSAQTLKVSGIPQIDANNNEPNWGDAITALIP